MPVGSVWAFFRECAIFLEVFLIDFLDNLVLAIYLDVIKKSEENAISNGE